MSKDFKNGDSAFRVFFNFGEQEYKIFPVTVLCGSNGLSFHISPRVSGFGETCCFDSDLFKTEQQAAKEITNRLQDKIKENAREMAALEKERDRLAADMEKFEKLACGEQESSHASDKQ